ncbi:MAG TPA: HNH endonuclease signature motif containing protein, partial [Streptosporangiaceae bacterium]|nr:HNH endonuclease signature motif containing protein [Streptosporangiaceae bacterium]
MEHQILGQILQVVSGPGGAASFLRRHLLGKPLAGPSLPLDVGQTDDIPVHLRRLVALRDQTCQFAGGCDQPASGCEPHHVTHRADGGHTSLTNLKDYCWWHHHVVLHELGWTLTVHPDGTSQVQSPDGKIIRSHSPHPDPGNQPRPQACVVTSSVSRCGGISPVPETAWSRIGRRSCLNGPHSSRRPVPARYPAQLPTAAWTGSATRPPDGPTGS